MARGGVSCFCEAIRLPKVPQIPFPGTPVHRRDSPLHPTASWVRPRGIEGLCCVLCVPPVCSCAGRGTATRGGGLVGIPDGAGPGPCWFTFVFLFSEMCLGWHCLVSGGTDWDSRSLLSLKAPQGLSHIMLTAAGKAQLWDSPRPWNVPHGLGKGTPDHPP